MKLLSYGLDQNMEPRLAFSLRGYAIDVMRASLWMKENHNAQDYLHLASSLKLVLRDWNRSQPLLKNLEQAFQGMELPNMSIYNRPVAHPETEIIFFSPIPDPCNLRYFNGFETNVDFSFGNTQTLKGHRQMLRHSGLSAMGEIAGVIAGKGSELEIAGYCIVVNWIDLEKAPHNDGLARGLATSIGPYFVTADELETHKLGKGFNLELQIRLNGIAVSEGHFKNPALSFPEMIRLAAPTNLQAGDIFCSGNPHGTTRKLLTKPGDRVEVEIQILGTLANEIGMTTTVL